MFFTYLLVAWRNLAANKLFSIINVLGLAIGLSVCLLISMYVRYEFSYDQNVKHSENTYRVTRHYDAEDMNLAAIAPAFRPLLDGQFQEIKASTLIGMGSAEVLNVEDRIVTVTRSLYADSDIFDVLDLNVIAGSADHALDRMNTTVLTESIARKLFGENGPQKAIGQLVYINQNRPVEVTAVIQDLPENTHLDIEILGSLEAWRQWIPHEFKSWDVNYFYLYLKLQDGVPAYTLENKFPSLMTKLGDVVSSDQRLALQAVTDIHLHSNYRLEMKANGSHALIVGFIIIACVIVLIASINYMNLSTAQATRRALDVGVRKSLGASRSQLATQYLVESILVSLFAMLLGGVFVELIFPWFAHFVGRDLPSAQLYEPTTVLAMAALSVVVGIVAGSYPALYLSSFKPADVFKHSFATGGANGIRKVLVVVQFSISIVLIIATIIVTKQTEFARSSDPGYERANNISIKISDGGGFGSRHAFYNLLKERLLANPLIESVAASQQLPTAPLQDIWAYVTEKGTVGAGDTVNLPTLNVGFHFFEHFDINLIAGRTFSEDMGDQFVRIPTTENVTGSGNAVISESAAKAIGYSPSEAIDKFISIPFPPGITHYRILGVVEDIHFGSLRDEQTPQVYHLVPRERLANVRFAEGRQQEALSFVQATWSELLPNRTMNFSFLDDTFNAMYLREDKQARLFSIFALIAIAVATLGLFGLSAFTAERRKKEIGVRKVMGAKVRDIVLLITRDFSTLVLVANLIAWPIAYLLMRDWLSSFNESINLNIDVFLLSGFLSLSISWLTVASYAARAATNRPVESLKAE